MAVKTRGFTTTHVSVKKCTSQGTGGRSRRTKISMSHMNKSKKRYPISTIKFNISTKKMKI